MANKWKVDVYSGKGVDIYVVATPGLHFNLGEHPATARRLAMMLNELEAYRELGTAEELERCKPLASFAFELWAAVIEYIRDNGIEHEGTEKLLLVAEKHGYATHEEFDPVKHAHIDGAEDMGEGDFVWQWNNGKVIEDGE